MRLLSTRSLTLEDFAGSDIPDYAILSHTWGAPHEEVLFQDIVSGAAVWRSKSGAPKVENFCRLAARNGYEWVWIDTCCIDKSSSAELSEAINSMYRWYCDSHICYAYLGDVSSMDDLATSRWWTRGWTLQELIAPVEVELYNSSWDEICSRNNSSRLISEITDIEHSALTGDFHAGRYSVAARMSWAATRRTTRAEDMAYCLLGIFDVNLPLLYGEGEKAFQRLQEEILKINEDYSILAWKDQPLTHLDLPQDPTSVLARSPAEFGSGQQVSANIWKPSEVTQVLVNPFQQSEFSFRWPLQPSIQVLSRQSGGPRDVEPPRLTARGLRLTVPIIEESQPRHRVVAPSILLFLSCILRTTGAMVCLALETHDEISSSAMRGEYYRPRANAIKILRAYNVKIRFRTIFIRLMPNLTTGQIQQVYERRHGAFISVLRLGTSAHVPLPDTEGLPFQSPLEWHRVMFVGKESRFAILLSTSQVNPNLWCRVVESKEATPIPSREEAARLQDLFRKPWGSEHRSKSMLKLADLAIRCEAKLRPLGWLKTTNQEFYSASAAAAAGVEDFRSSDSNIPSTQKRNNMNRRVCSIQVTIEPEFQDHFEIFSFAKGQWEHVATLSTTGQHLKEEEDGIVTSPVHTGPVERDEDGYDGEIF